ncbi:hypothetical protein RN51_03232 [Microbacterium oxydans]|uniref:Uncharacterized protein n=1 Tax=Microbacterium oxydans TaxID=82380 RepID=A0A0F0KDA4_9MICO|nr:hypothetical protein [Microbacterium oxydans]KJL18399.1 hypothetical protein RN51_03232 [Microbacterium oxydans]
MNARQLRIVRAAALSSVATLLAALSHTLGGGAAPHALLIIAVATLITPLAALLVGVRRSRTRVALAVFLGQAAFHVVFQLLGSPTGVTPITAGGHSHHLDLSLLASASPVAAPGALMLSAHVVAAALTTLLVWHGEAIMRVVARWVDALFRRASAVAPSLHRRPERLRSIASPPFDAAVSVALPRRGPPALLRD